MQDKFFPRKISRTCGHTSATVLGCYSMSNSYGLRSDVESVQMIRRAIHQGINLLDTADFYGWGHNEQLVASASQGRPRQQVLLLSKFG